MIVRQFTKHPEEYRGRRLMHWLLVFLAADWEQWPGMASTARLCARLGAGTFRGGRWRSMLPGSFADRPAGRSVRPAGKRASRRALFLVTGFLGGFTTFSAFSLDALTLWERGAPGRPGPYVAGSVILSLLAAIAAGLMLSRLA